VKELLRVGDIIVVVNNNTTHGKYTINTQYNVMSIERNYFAVLDDYGRMNYFNYCCLDEGSSYYTFRCTRVERILKIRALCL